jgi:hypothetical protein
MENARRIYDPTVYPRKLKFKAVGLVEVSCGN